MLILMLEFQPTKLCTLMCQRRYSKCLLPDGRRDRRAEEAQHHHTLQEMPPLQDEYQPALEAEAGLVVLHRVVPPAERTGEMESVRGPGLL